MIPDRVIELLHGPAFMQVGTRDAGLRPAHTFAVGAVVHDDRQTITVFVPESRSTRVLSDLKANGRVALGVALVSHEAYQLKGTYLTSRATGDEETALQEAYRVKWLAAVRQVYPDEIARPLVLGFAYRPGVAITFRVEEVFLQTPGPGAGTKMV
ncbi:MAG: pyridoxamine 5'-phosphate oxidase family protein [Candidatus Rokubacteria bacterium]|nr:pyridoxamine 5'-phosphate oxidase family protein [Candidatus Rokubacteria bacterium]